MYGISSVGYTAFAHTPERRRYAEQATEHSHQAVRLRRPADRRWLIFDTISVATASTLSVDFITAGQHDTRAVTLVEDGMRSARVSDLLATLWHLAAHAEPPVRRREPRSRRPPEVRRTGTLGD